MPKLVEIDCAVEAETDLAIRIFDGNRECWIPKSAIKDSCGEEWLGVTSVFISEALATEKGLV